MKRVLIHILRGYVLELIATGIFGSCLLWVMSTEISVDIAVDSRSIVGRQSVDSRSIVGRYSVDTRSTVGRQSVDIAIDSRSTVGR